MVLFHRGTLTPHGTGAVQGATGSPLRAGPCGCVYMCVSATLPRNQLSLLQRPSEVSCIARLEGAKGISFTTWAVGEMHVRSAV
jgi:hypothetical protein